jgi:hypothetical protein
MTLDHDLVQSDALGRDDLDRRLADGSPLRRRIACPPVARESGSIARPGDEDAAAGSVHRFTHGRVNFTKEVFGLATGEPTLDTCHTCRRVESVSLSSSAGVLLCPHCAREVAP